MAKRKHHVNPYQLLSFTDLTHEYGRLLKVELTAANAEETRSQSRDLCDVLINRIENYRDALMADTIRSMIGRLQTHVGDQ